MVYTGVEVLWDSRKQLDEFLADIKLLVPYTTGLGTLFVICDDDQELRVNISNQLVTYE